MGSPTPPFLRSAPFWITLSDPHPHNCFLPLYIYRDGKKNAVLSVFFFFSYAYALGILVAVSEAYFCLGFVKQIRNERVKLGSREKCFLL